MDIIFYRNVNLSIEEIRSIQNSPHQLHITLELAQQKKHMIQKIIQEQQRLLQKFETLEFAHNAIDHHLGQYIVMPLPSFYVVHKINPELLPSQAQDTFFANQEFDLCTFGGHVIQEKGKWVEGDYCILMKRKLASNLGVEEQLRDRPVIGSRRGVYTVFLAKSDDYMHREIVRLLNWMVQSGYQLVDKILFNYMLTYHVKDVCQTYVELFAPVV